MTRPRHIEGLANVDAALHGCALTIGNFDGVHRGHRQIIATARALADAAGVPVVAMTFQPAPEQVLFPDTPSLMISPHAQTIDLLGQAGADVVVTVQATREFLATEADVFLDEIIHGRFAPSHIVEGPNFFFGRKRSGSVATLQEAADRLDFTVHVVDAVLVELDGEPTTISSTLIRKLIMAGRVEEASRLLTRPFSLSAPVIEGDKVGHRLLRYPTANIDPAKQVIPGHGVYAAVGVIDRQRWPAAISIGTKPTFGSDRLHIEANLIGADGDYYGRDLDVLFIEKLRDQEAFENLDELREQIARDVARTQEVVRDLL